ncbi:hypothetical protein [Catenulispora yoronensis]|uniref:hypothetical protein n=1 Tax=Catenulispora yoronensis TaxID=450799 RepID=UPI0031D76EA8
MRWLTVFARELESRESSGVIRPVVGVRSPWSSLRPVHPFPAAFIALDEELVSGGAGLAADVVVSGSALDWCRQAANWVNETGGDLNVDSRGLNQRVAVDGAARYMLRGLHVDANAYVSSADADAGRAAHATVSRNGQLVCQLYNADPVLAAQLERVREMLTADPAVTRLGFVLGTQRRVLDWLALESRWPALGSLTPPLFRRNDPIWSSQVPDACGIQLLTQRHLDRAADLSAWQVEELCPGRYLVEAADVEGWYGPHGPSESTLAQARSDFGAMIVDPA